MKTMETTDERLKALGGKKISTVVDGHCLMWACTRGFHIPKSSARAVLLEELLSKGCYYAHLLVRNSFRLILKTILEKKKSIEKVTWISHSMFLLMYIAAKLLINHSRYN